MTTNTKIQTLQEALEKAEPNTLADALRKLGFSKSQSKVKITVAALTAAAAIDVTTAAVKAAATISGITLANGENLPAIGKVVSLRVSTSGTANTVGSYAITDDGGTVVSPTASANVGLAKLSDDGKTLTFPTTVTGFVLEYYPKQESTQVEFGSNL